MANKEYWAGFCEDQVAETLEHYGEKDRILAIYLLKKDAKKNYQDVRKVKIIQVRKSSSHKK